MNNLPKIEPRVYNFEPRELPSNSYLPIGSSIYGKFAPFFCLGEGGLGEHKQLNWTNLYLINKLGSTIDEQTCKIIDKINSAACKEKIEELIKELPTEIQRLIKQYDDLNMKIIALNQLEKSLETQIIDIKLELKEIKLMLKEIKFGLGLGVGPRKQNLQVGETSVET